MGALGYKESYSFSFLLERVKMISYTWFHIFTYVIQFTCGYVILKYNHFPCSVIFCYYSCISSSLLLSWAVFTNSTDWDRITFSQKLPVTCHSFCGKVILKVVCRAKIHIQFYFLDLQKDILHAKLEGLTGSWEEKLTTFSYFSLFCSNTKITYRRSWILF